MVTPIQSVCCWLDCPEIATWHYHKIRTHPSEVSAACDDHLGHLVDGSPCDDGCLPESTVWPLVNGYDPGFYSHEQLVEVGAIDE